MKRFFLLSISILCVMFAFSQTTATNFSVNDCNDVNHDLFSELDDNKVIVIAWVMPCLSCIEPTASAYLTVQTYSGSNPGQVLFYMVDDYANTTCSTLNSWATVNKMDNVDAFFSNSEISMSDYGTDGMPKIIVVGGSSHKVYYNENYTANDIDLAIDEAILDCSVAIEENINNGNFELKIFPNPVNEIATINNQIVEKSEITIKIVNIIGETVDVITNLNQNVGTHELQFSTNKLSDGYYFLKIQSEENTQVIKFSVKR